MMKMSRKRRLAALFGMPLEIMIFAVGWFLIWSSQYKAPKCIDRFIKNHMRRLFKYALVGTVGTLINLSILYALTEYFDVWYFASAIVATLISFLANYTANTLWTYRDAMKKLEGNDE